MVFVGAWGLGFTFFRVVVLGLWVRIWRSRPYYSHRIRVSQDSLSEACQSCTILGFIIIIISIV